MLTILQLRDDLAKRRRMRGKRRAAERRSLYAWQCAAEHLNALGYPAIVPPELVPPLRRAGLAVWPGQRRDAA